MNDNQLENLKEVLAIYTDDHFKTLVPKQILKLSDQEASTIEFAFWFCHIVERDLAEILKRSSDKSTEILGKSENDVDKILKNKYGLKFEKVDSTHENYNENNIDFGDRIEFAAKMQGETPQVKYFRKIKSIRNDLSHLRIDNLSYEGEPLTNRETKAKMAYDYISSMMADQDFLGGAAADLTDEDKKRINELWNEWHNK